LPRKAGSGPASVGERTAPIFFFFASEKELGGQKTASRDRRDSKCRAAVGFSIFFFPPTRLFAFPFLRQNISTGVAPPKACKCPRKERAPMKRAPQIRFSRPARPAPPPLGNPHPSLPKPHKKNPLAPVIAAHPVRPLGPKTKKPRLRPPLRSPIPAPRHPPNRPRARRVSPGFVFGSQGLCLGPHFLFPFFPSPAPERLARRLGSPLVD